MSKYVSFNPNAQVIGKAILGVASALGERAKPSLEKYGLDKVKPDGWYPQQSWLNALREFDQESMFDLIAVGKHVAEHVPLPDEVDSVEAVLMLIGKTYSHNHRNCPGYSRSELVGDNHIQVTVHDPYPNNMVYGVLFGFASRFTRRVVVRYADETPYGTDSDTVVFHVTW